MSLRDHLREIHDHHGKLTPRIVLKEARKQNHPLHDRFEWDDRKCGQAYRLIQARELIVSVKQSFKSEKEPDVAKSLRSFYAIRLTEKEGGGYSYEPLDKVVADPILTEIVLKDMEREWLTLRRRYDDFSEFWEMIKRDLAA